MAASASDARATMDEVTGLAVNAEMVGYHGLEGLAGWDAEVDITEPGVDPFMDLTDDELMDANPAVIAAIAAAQSNQMRILDSSAVPDGHLVLPTGEGREAFNEIVVSTPTVPAEKYVVWNEKGFAETVDSGEAFYPGLSEREEVGKAPLELAMDEDVADPFALALGYGCALIQIGLEADMDVREVANILSKAWGANDLFSATTVAALEGASEYSELFGMDRSANARRLSSWQACSAVRSGQLAMTKTDWGDYLHCDFRRVRVAAETMFAATVTMDSLTRVAKGRLAYFVPPTSLLSANPEFLFFRNADSALMPTVATPSACSELVMRASKEGLMRVLWPRTDPVISEAWVSTAVKQMAVASIPTVFAVPDMAGAALVGAATARAAKLMPVSAGATGRTIMTKLSAKICSMVEQTLDARTVRWAARLLACAEVLQCTRSDKARNAAADELVNVLTGDCARVLERSLTSADAKEVWESLPQAAKATCKMKSSRTVVRFLLHTLSAPRVSSNHTIFRGVRRALARAKAVASATMVSGTMFDPDKAPVQWVAGKVARLREFWAGIYSAMHATRAAWKYLASDVAWWVDLASCVNQYRAAVMRSISVNADQRVRNAQEEVIGVGVYMAPYSAAAALRKELEATFAVEIAEFGHRANISHWLSAVLTKIGPLLTMASKPSVVARAEETSSIFFRAVTLLDGEKAMNLAEWTSSCLTWCVQDVEALVSKLDVVKPKAAPPLPVAVQEANKQVMEEAFARLDADLAAVMNAKEVSESVATVAAATDDDAWDEFVLAVEDADHSLHESAKSMMEEIKRGTTADREKKIAEIINSDFMEEDEDEGIGGTIW